MMTFTDLSTHNFYKKENTQLLMMTFTDRSACISMKQKNTQFFMMTFTDRSACNFFCARTFLLLLLGVK
jgi:hypothetical protein